MNCIGVVSLWLDPQSKQPVMQALFMTFRLLFGQLTFLSRLLTAHMTAHMKSCQQRIPADSESAFDAWRKRKSMKKSKIRSWQRRKSRTAPGRSQWRSHGRPGRRPGRRERRCLTLKKITRFCVSVISYINYI